MSPSCRPESSPQALSTQFLGPHLPSPMLRAHTVPLAASIPLLFWAHSPLQQLSICTLHKPHGPGSRPNFCSQDWSTCPRGLCTFSWSWVRLSKTRNLLAYPASQSPLLKWWAGQGCRDSSIGVLRMLMQHSPEQDRIVLM